MLVVITVEFKDYSIEVKAKLNDAAIAYLHEAAGEIVSQTQRNTRVDTGQLKSSWDYVVDENKLRATIGSPLQNAIWEEFGTGEYAIKGNGRKSKWRYKDAHGNWHTTTGKKPSKAFSKAFNSLRKTLIAMAKRIGDDMK